MSFIGQADASDTSDGADIYELVKGIVNGFDTSRRLFPSIKVLTSDGGSSLRSTHTYRGVTARGGDGSSFVAAAWRAGNQLLAVHCLPHQGNLALGIMLMLTAMKQQWA